MREAWEEGGENDEPSNGRTNRGRGRGGEEYKYGGLNPAFSDCL